MIVVVSAHIYTCPRFVGYIIAQSFFGVNAHNKNRANAQEKYLKLLNVAKKCVILK
jgi:hypothetical protein